MTAVDDAHPLDPASIVDAFQHDAQLIGRTVSVKWRYADRPERTYEWDGRILGYEAQTHHIRVFYWKQDGFPRLAAGVPGIEVLLPRDGVSYLRIQVTQAHAVTAEALRSAIEGEENEDARHFQGGMDAFVLHDVLSWHAVDDPSGLGGEIVKNRIQQHAAVSLVSSALRRDAMNCVANWIDCARSMEGWRDADSFVRLGNNLVQTLRLCVASEAQGVSAEAVHTAIAQQDETDPVGQAIAKLAKTKQPAKPSFRKCTLCHKTGHTASYCWEAKNKDAKDKDKDGKNGSGGGKKH